ncbi:ATP-dependent DNA helicase RecG [Patescibacteria group bacterium]|nr:ATP-dependent DNA helicase RecG [Patescibacteria group bacterium]
MITSKTLISQLTRVGKATANQLEKIGLKTVQDLIDHYPFRYDDYSKIFTIAKLKTQKSGTIKAKINLIANHRLAKKRMIITEAIVSDQSDSIKIIWFNQGYLTKVLKSGQKIYLAGKVNYDDYYGVQMINPSYEIPSQTGLIHTGRLVPIYSTTARLSQKQIRFLIRQTLILIQQTEDWLPRMIRAEHNLIGLSYALEQIHFPQNQDWLTKATRRLKFDELLLIQLKNQLVRQKIKNRRAPQIKFKLKQTQNFVKSLPFKLTQAQKKSSWEIIKNLEKKYPMNRLLEGDVGSGKTVVAVIAILNTLLNNYQTAYMAPTEILSEQHFKTISKLLENFNFKIGLLTSGNSKINTKAKIKKAELLKKISTGDIQLIIGTHALIQEKIKFKNLGLAIVDEQHRFGIKQRAKLIQKSISIEQKNYSPHFLSLAATPIPRSVALTLYGDLDLSIIDEMPPGRLKVITKIIKPAKIKNTYQFVIKEIKKGRQAFIICPLIDPSDKLGVKSVKEEYKKLKEQVFSEFKIGLLHGRLKTKEKEKIMKDFAQNKIKILISTTVVEVGIDVPNASIMIIEGAERFGLAQLYQLRGRIGRSHDQSYCFLFLESEGEKTKIRLKALLSAKDGFELAQIDLDMRGPGEIFGAQQSGFLTDFKIAKLSDLEIISLTQKTAQQIFDQSPNLEKYPSIKKKINQLSFTAHLE